MSQPQQKEQPKQQQQQQHSHHHATGTATQRLFAGAVAGIADVWSCHGLDRIKTHMQQHPGKTFAGSFQEIYAKGGITALYEGVLPMTFEAIVKVGLRFYVFNAIKDAYKLYVQKETNPNVPVSVAGNVIGGGMAGAVESLVVVIPCELLKVRHMTQTHHESFITVAKNTIKEDGLLGLYKGGSATLLRQVTNHMIRFPVFYAASSYIKEKQNTNKLSEWVNLSLGAFAGMTSTVFNTPLDTIKTRMQKAGQKASTAEIISGIYKERGVLGFWAGVIPRAVRVAPGQAITFMVYEWVMHLLTKEEDKKQ